MATLRLDADVALDTDAWTLDGVAVVPVPGWWGMVAMRAEQIDPGPARPTVCPTSGDLLVSDRDGNLICPFDGWRYP